MLKPLGRAFFSENAGYSKPVFVPSWLRKLPNRLTFFRMLCIPAVVYLMNFSQITESVSLDFWHAKAVIPSATDIWAAILFSLAALTDYFDGMIARRFQIESMLGKLLDPLADKLLVVSALVILVEKHRLAGWIAVIIIVRDLGINAIRLSAQDDGVQIPSSFCGKTKTTLLDFGILGLMVYGNLWLIPFHYLGHIFMFLALCASLVSAFQYLLDYAKQLKMIQRRS